MSYSSPKPGAIKSKKGPRPLFAFTPSGVVDCVPAGRRLYIPGIMPFSPFMPPIFFIIFIMPPPLIFFIMPCIWSN